MPMLHFARRNTYIDVASFTDLFANYLYNSIETNGLDKSILKRSEKRTFVNDYL